MRAVAGDVLVCFGAAVTLLGCVGATVFRSAYDRLHFAGPPVLGALLIAAAILVRDGFSLVADKALLIAAFLLVCGPLLTHASAKAIRAQEHGDWRAGVGTEIEVEQR